MDQDATRAGAAFEHSQPVAEWDPHIQQLHAYWLSLHERVGDGKSGLLPGRQHFDPIEIPSLLPYLKLIEVHREPVRLRYRLVGTVEAAIYGDHTGRWFEELFSDHASSPVLKEYLGVIENGRPSYYCGVPRMQCAAEVDTVERLALPLARDGVNVDMLLSVFIHQMKMPPRR